MADLNATQGYNDMTSYDFAHSGCAWCHPGGGPMEYDRDGYRFDGDVLGSGLGVSGLNPEVTNASGILSTTTRKGDYYVFDPNTKTIAEPSTVVNQGASSPQGTASPTTAVYMKTWAQGGVAEADCMMCHLDGQYANLERAYAFPGATAPKLAASLGLAGAKGETGFISGSGATPFARATATSNPANLANTNWQWDNVDLVPKIIKTPKRENCTICHFPDKSWWANCAASNWAGYNSTHANCGPASKPFGAAMFQKLIPAGAAVDGDLIAAGSTNAADWKVAKGRVEGGKRGESLNDGNNADAHMKTSGLGMSCINCHNTLEGDADPIADSSGNVIQPGMTVHKIDHQFAKGNNAPDGKNMDQLDNTATCSGCHIERTHPNAGTAPNPATAHAGFPALHFSKIDCKTCHIPVLNGPVKQLVADFTAGPFQTFERTQTLESPAGINMKPLYMWRATEHDGSGMQIEPIMTMTVPVWANRVVNPDSSVSYNPTYQRAAKMAAEKYRSLSGDNGTSYNFRLNAAVSYATAGTSAQVTVTSANCTTGTCTFAAKGGALAINTATEIAGVADIFKNPGSYSMPAQFSAVGEPVINFYFNQFALSHNIATKASGKILGSAAGGGCVICHSSSNPASPSYSPKSVGFFDKTFTLFAKPTDGLRQTFNVGSTATSIPRLNMKFPAKKSDGTSFSIDLANVAEGEDVTNSLDQGAVLGYTASQLAILKNPATAGVILPVARFSSTNSITVSRLVSFNASASVCDGGCTSYAWDFGDSSAGTGATTSHTYATAGDYTVKLTVTGTKGNTASRSRTVTAADLNDLPTVDSSSVSVSNMTASLTVSNPSADVAKLIIDWGDGSLPEKKTSGFAGPHTHAYTLKGSYVIKFTVLDDKNLRNVYWVDGDGNPANGSKTPITVPNVWSISGSVKDGSTGISGATVYLKEGTTTLKIVVSDASGNFSFAGIRNGSYTVEAKKSGYLFDGQSADVSGGNVTGIDLTAKRFTLTVAKSGAGAGTVSSGGTTPLISCGTDCTEDYLANTIVTLTATASSGSSFGGWTGCTVSPTNPNRCTVKVDAAKNVDAAFTTP